MYAHYIIEYESRKFVLKKYYTSVTLALLGVTGMISYIGDVDNMTSCLSLRDSCP